MSPLDRYKLLIRAWLGARHTAGELSESVEAEFASDCHDQWLKLSEQEQKDIEPWIEQVKSYFDSYYADQAKQLQSDFIEEASWRQL